MRNHLAPSLGLSLVEGTGAGATGRAGGSVGPDDHGLSVALAQLPGRLRRAIRLFRELTGFTAVTSIRCAAEDRRGADTIVPPLHPRCASLLRTTSKDAPCEEEWRKHMKAGLRSHGVQSHVCSLGLRCSCVPIFFGETLVGIAKFVADPKTTDRRTSLGVRTLESVVSQVCQEFYVSTLTEELSGLRQKVTELQRVHGGGGAESAGGGLPYDAPSTRAATVQAGSRVEEVLEYVHRHYLDPSLSLAAVSQALGLSDKYLTHLFTQVVGQRMHAYIVQLRLQHSRRQLLTTGMLVKQIAYESGFRRPDRFRRAFRKQVGVAPSTYRTIFTRT